MAIQTFHPTIPDLGFQWPLLYSLSLIVYHLNLPIDCTDFSDLCLCVMPILLNREDCLFLRFSGGISQRRYLRSRTDEFSPHHLYGDVILVFDPGIYKGIGFRIGLLSSMTWSEDDALSFYRLRRLVFRQGETTVTNQQRVLRLKHHGSQKMGMIPHLQEGVRRRHNTSSRSSFLFQREADVFTMTSKSSQQLKVMLKAFWSLSYMLLAINIKYMKGGPISHSLIARKAYIQQAGLTHSIIEATASHICEKRLYPSSLSLLYERICVSNLVYPNDVLFCY